MEREGGRGEIKERERKRQDIPAKISREWGYQICIRASELYMPARTAAFQGSSLGESSES